MLAHVLEADAGARAIFAAIWRHEPDDSPVRRIDAVHICTDAPWLYLMTGRHSISGPCKTGSIDDVTAAWAAANDLSNAVRIAGRQPFSAVTGIVIRSFMRLADFIEAHVEPILAEWEMFARSIWPSPNQAEPAELRDDAADILHGAVEDMRSHQTATEQAEKSRGRTEEADTGLSRASSTHGTDRVASGFALWAVIAEYRALRASVLRLWRDSNPVPDLNDLDDVTRFNESIDQSLTHAVRTHGERVDRDREARLANEQALRREADAANRAKDLFLATLSHEMRTPLNAIVGWLRLLRNEESGKEHFQEGLTVIERNTKAQVQLIDDVLDLSRIVAGKMSVEMHACELIDVINAGVSVARPAADARGISLNVQLDPSASAASGDAGRLQQVVWNLVSNAVKFTPKGGRIDVMLTRAQSNIQLQVSDTGQGISPELLPRIFDPFWQGDSGTRRAFGGLGLGLSIVKYIVEAHGGTVEAQSDGKGSTFTVRLPIRAVQMADDHPDGFADRPEGTEESVFDIAADVPLVRLDGLRVLVVDDEVDARRVLTLILERSGATVFAAVSVREAIESFTESRPDILITDLGMPVEDGFDLIRQIRGAGPDATNLPAIALTAYAHKEDARLALSAGFQVHLSKPVDPHQLTSVIAGLAGRSRDVG